MNTVQQQHRTPHAIQAGPTTAILWVLNSLLGLACTAAAMTLPWHIGNSVARTELTTPIWGLVLMVAGFSIINRYLSHTIALRTPGGLRSYTRDELPLMPTLAPVIVLSFAHAATALFLGLWTLLNATPGDKGFTTASLTFFAAGFIAIRFGRTLRSIADKSFSLRQLVLLEAPEAIVFTFLVALAFNGEPGSAFMGVTFAAIPAVLMWIIHLLARTRPGEALDNLAEGVLHYVNPSPTLESRRKAKDLARAAAVLLAMALAVLWVIAL